MLVSFDLGPESQIFIDLNLSEEDRPVILQNTPPLSFLGKDLFIYLWLCWVFTAARVLSLVVASRGFSLLAALRLLTAVASLVVERGLECWLSSCGTQA